MNAYRIALLLVTFGATACLETRNSSGDDLGKKVVPASVQDTEPVQVRGYPAEARIVAVLNAESPETELRPHVAIGCMPWGDLPFIPEFMEPETAVFPKFPTEAECRALAQELLPDGWSLGPPTDSIAKCCLVNGVWVPCHPGWDSRSFPILRGPERYSSKFTITSNGREETFELGFMAVVTAGPGEAGAPGDDK